MPKLFIGKISKQLFAAMLVIVLTLFIIAIPLILTSYKNYQLAIQSLQQIKILQSLTLLSNKISRERGPSNFAMSQPNNQKQPSIIALNKYRHEVDLQFDQTITELKAQGYDDLAANISIQVRPSLLRARQRIDTYLALPDNQRTSKQMYHTIIDMFNVWNSNYTVLKQYYYQTNHYSQNISDSFTLIFILADLRDQSGRIASNIIAPVTFNEPIPEINKERASNNRQSILYLWNIIQAINAQKRLPAEYYQKQKIAEYRYLRKGLAMIEQEIQQGNHPKYIFNGPELTELFVDKLGSIVDLQSYILKYSIDTVNKNIHSAKLLFLITLFLLLVALSILVFIIFYIHAHVFLPLLKVKDIVLSLAEQKQPITHIELPKISQHNEFYSLFEALVELEHRLEQRKILEQELNQIAHTDSLTNINNRLALENYINFLEKHPAHFLKTGLIIIDVDNFKDINDSYGHVIGDQALVFVATQLKKYIRPDDQAFRYGGDEFLILCDQVDAQTLLCLANKIKQAFSDKYLEIDTQPHKLYLSISMGIALNCTSWIDLISKADQSLFVSKTQGKNRITFLPTDI